MGSGATATGSGSGSGIGAGGSGSGSGSGSGNGSGSARIGATSVAGSSGRATGSAGATGAGGALTTGAAATAGVSSGRMTAGAMCGGSTRALYSRTTLPRPQLASIRKVRKGSLKRLEVVTRMTGWPWALRPTSICRLAVRPTGRSRPTRAKASGEARRTSSSSSSPGAADRMGISATSGWFRPDFTSSAPRPRAWTGAAPKARARANGSCRCLIFTRGFSPTVDGATTPLR